MASNIRSDRGKHKMEYLKQSSRTKPPAALLAFVAIALAVVIDTVAKPVSAANDYYMFCFVDDRQEKTMYYSTMFLGDYSQVTRAKLDFHGYLEDAGRDPNFPPICPFGRIYEEIEQKLERKVRQHQMYPYSEWTIVPTNWKPGYSAPLPLGNVVAKSADAAEDDDDYMFCEADDREEKTVYFSAIFPWDYSFSDRARLDFHGYLKDAGKSPNFLGIICWTGSIYGDATYEETERKLEDRVRERQWYPYTDWAIVHTNWKPGYSAPQQQDESGDSHGRESGGNGCYFGECPDGTDPAPQSPNTPIPSQQTSRRTLICQTPDGWCEMSTGLPIGVPCGCLTLSGPIGGITVPSMP